jgi:hypothetical protein
MFYKIDVTNEKNLVSPTFLQQNKLERFILAAFLA